MDRTPVEMMFAKASLAKILGAFRAMRIGINSFMKQGDGPTMVWSLQSSPQSDL